MKKKTQKVQKEGIIAKTIRLLAAGNAAYVAIPQDTLEDNLSWYMKLLLLMAVVAGVFSFLKSLAWAGYLHLGEGVTIELNRLTNYAFGIATGTFFVYLFVGTFGLFLFSIIVWLILGKRLKFTHTIMACTLSMAPVLLIGWLDSSIAAVLFLWMAFLLVTGLRAMRQSPAA